MNSQQNPGSFDLKIRRVDFSIELCCYILNRLYGAWFFYNCKLYYIINILNLYNIYVFQLVNFDEHPVQLMLDQMILGNILPWDFAFLLELLCQQLLLSIQTLLPCRNPIMLFALVFNQPTTITRFDRLKMPKTNPNPWDSSSKNKLFKGNTSTLKIDRGHLLPNGIYNQDLDAAKATFTLTNVAPQVGFQTRSLIGPLQTNQMLVLKQI